MTKIGEKESQTRSGCREADQKSKDKVDELERRAGGVRIARGMVEEVVMEEVVRRGEKAVRGQGMLRVAAAGETRVVEWSL